MQQPSASRWPTKTMINLLPDEYKNLVEREYQGRILTGMLLFFIITVIISIIFLIPSYFISQIEYSSALDRAEKNIPKSEPDSLGTSDIIKKINNGISLLRISSSDNKVLVNQLIDSLITKKNSLISIKSINYEMRGETAKIDITGVANTRESLLLFVDNLKKEKNFAEVYSPVSNLVKERNVDFSVQIAISPEL